MTSKHKQKDVDSYVSIHTPTQGVTARFVLLNTSSAGFNPHTHAGCDSARNDDSVAIARFNPHTHAGCDQGTVPFDREIKVSIHTPTQGVTRFVNCSSDVDIVSIHTPTQGVTLFPCSIGILQASFNPHTHAGCD